MLEIENKIAVTASCKEMHEKAHELACRLHLPFIVGEENRYQYLLIVTEKRLELCESGSKKNKPIYVDFLARELDYRIKHGGGKQQLIAKAVGIKGGYRPKVLDVSAGFGVDAFVLAALGCEVVMLERSQIVGALLEDGLMRFKCSGASDDLKMSLFVVSAADYLNDIIGGKIEPPDVIYFDPMYPERRKSALNKKKMRILHDIVGADDDASEIFHLACLCAAKRIVVKRPKNAEELGTIVPSVVFFGSSCRYDVYTLR